MYYTYPDKIVGQLFKGFHHTKWLFPQGKARDCANEVRLRGHEVVAVLGNPPPPLQVDEALLADAKWFNKRWLVAFNQGEHEVSM